MTLHQTDDALLNDLRNDDYPNTSPLLRALVYQEITGATFGQALELTIANDRLQTEGPADADADA